ncbi:mannitol dehydrogenase [Boudabousia tangfeifanii]|uniref:Mannitol dehydrogenase n=1 Tax=Boudabousia tangfeifanii TaxID=1912795 RepID=A0A1D9MJT6_9ACTO|nr:mannitol dehydrogenase family protein [Boudabousia tangfeifanii]AOZ72567.1 mannitol dehydrogenase [Boudabousia tangfeifanii]
MRLNVAGLEQLAQAKAEKKLDLSLPDFSVAQMQEQAKENPRWVHIGPGNIFRVFLARIAHEMLAAGHHWPITAVVPLDPQELDIQLAAHDLMSLGVTLHPQGELDLQVIAGLGEGLATKRTADFERLQEIFADPKVTLLSFTVTEKGYAIHTSAGELAPAVSEAISVDPWNQESDSLTYQGHTMALVAALLLKRYHTAKAPITLLSCDNFSHNGDKLRDSVLTIVKGWQQAGFVSEDFVAWVSDRKQVAFPISVIDKITPRPNAKISEKLTELGFEDMGIETLGRTPLAGFVNTEPAEYLVIEDAFAETERPPFEDFGVSITSREVCDDFEHMKVTTCLNPLHTALAVSGCLLEFPTIDSEMRDPALAKLVDQLGWQEGMPVVIDPKIVSPAEFLKEVLEVRFPNPYLPDDPARIAMDTSQKLPIRFGQTLLRYQERGLSTDNLVAMPMVFALWLRYLLGVTDIGEEFQPASDPLLDELQAQVSPLKLGNDYTLEQIHEVVSPILANANIFGVNLYDVNLGERTEALLQELLREPGAVRRVLDQHFAN